jgi:hypothetical protein
MAEPENVMVRGVMVVVKQERDRRDEKRPGAPDHARSLHRGTSKR